MRFLQQDKGGLLWHQPVSPPPPWWDSDPAPTVTLITPDAVSVFLAEQEAMVGPASTVGEEGASEGAVTVPVEDTTGMLTGNREQYLIGPSADQQQWEWAELVGVSSDSVRLRRPLRYGYAEGDPIRSARLSVVIEGSEVPTVYQNAFALWRYYVDGVVYEERIPFTVSPWNPRIPATPNDLLRIYPKAENQTADLQSLDDLLAEKWEEVLEELTRKVVDPGRIVSGAPLRHLLLYRLRRDLAADNNEATIFELYHQLYDEAMAAAIATTPVDADGSGSVSIDDVVPPAMVGRFWRG